VRLGRHDELDREAADPERAARDVTGSRLKAAVPVRILVVDDAAVVRDVCAELIRGLGYDVNVVADAAEALARLRNERFDAVITDIVLPGMDGWQLIAAAIREQPMLRLVAMTGAGGEGDRERALAYRCCRSPLRAWNCAMRCRRRWPRSDDPDRPDWRLRERVHRRRPIRKEVTAGCL
jgi:CheY-like chemotaxis protein